ncbi:MAG: hypothetical protein OXB95_14540, partial [Rhodobacteraceae bacterium]|nr:hypothetical protein [Paracoccaceae bacterium]
MRSPEPGPRRFGDDASREASPPAASKDRHTLYLVSCVKTKRQTLAPAKDLYVSTWFRKARACVEKTGSPWRILSAEYGLLHPDEEVLPYERTLNAMGVRERRAWAEDVLAHIETCLDGVDTVVFLAGLRYREFLEPALRNRGLAVIVPMKGLSQGQQLQWLTSNCDRFCDTRRFYQLMERLEGRVGGTRLLVECTGRMDWPKRGLYFFFEPGEARSGSGTGLRVVRVGTHALKEGSKSTLWRRLYQHRGPARTGGGNHRGSIFRLLIGIALASRSGIPLPPSWGLDGDRGPAARRIGMERAEVKRSEAELEASVSRYIGAMPFLFLGATDAPGRDTERGCIERNAIALLSAYSKASLDPASAGWLGRSSDRERVRLSGLWNNNHVDEAYHPSFLDLMEKRI